MKRLDSNKRKIVFDFLFASCSYALMFGSLYLTMSKNSVSLSLWQTEWGISLDVKKDEIDAKGKIVQHVIEKKT